MQFYTSSQFYKYDFKIVKKLSKTKNIYNINNNFLFNNKIFSYVSNSRSKKRIVMAHGKHKGHFLFSIMSAQNSLKKQFFLYY